MVLSKIQNTLPGFHELEEILSPDLIAESIIRVLDPKQIREMIGFLNEVLDDL